MTCSDVTNAASCSPTVSIIVPEFNCCDLLDTCIASLLDQTYQAIEIIVIDDGSDDGSLELIKEYSSADSRIIVLQQNHSGAGAARNLGLDHAKGEFIAFLDADDFFDQRLVESSLACIQENDADICVFGAWSYNHATGERMVKRNVCRIDLCPSNTFSPSENPLHIFTFTTAAPWSKLYRASFLKKENLRFQQLPNSNDLAFTMLANAIAKRIAVLDLQLVNYRVNRTASTQGSKVSNPLAFYSALEELKVSLETRNVYLRFERSYLDLALENCLYNLRSVSHDERAATAIFNMLANGGFELLGLRDQPIDYFPTCTKARYCDYQNVIRSSSYAEYQSLRRKNTLRRWIKKHLMGI